MSKINSLINKLCPNGVKYKNLGEVCSRIYAGGTPKTAYEEYYNGDIKWLRSGEINFNEVYDTEIKITELGLNNSSAKIIPKNSVVIAMTGATVARTAMIMEDMSMNQSVCALIPSAELNYRFLYQCLTNKYKELKESGQGVLTSLNLDRIKKISVPVPPLEVQEEIVRILDKFGELEAELEVELEARKSQYEFLRGKLLSKEDSFKPIKNILKNYCSGATPLKGNSDFYENGDIPWLRTQEVRFNEIVKTECFITKFALEKTGVKYIPANCVIVAMSGATAGRCAINKIPLTTNQHCLNLEVDSSKANYKYVYYCMCNAYDDLTSKKEGARGDLNSSKIINQKIPIPSLEEQERIVNILDKFDKLVNDISVGLPAEIEYRRKQYEYYRNKILSFEEV